MWVFSALYEHGQVTCEVLLLINRIHNIAMKEGMQERNCHYVYVWCFVSLSFLQEQL